MLMQPEIYNYPEDLFGDNMFICDWRTAAFAASLFRTDITAKDVICAGIRYPESAEAEEHLRQEFLKTFEDVDEDIIDICWEELTFRNTANSFQKGMNTLTADAGVQWNQEHISPGLNDADTEHERSKIVQANAHEPLICMLLSCPELKGERIAWHFCCATHGDIWDYKASTYATTEQYVEFLFRPTKSPTVDFL